MRLLQLLQGRHRCDVELLFSGQAAVQVQKTRLAPFQIVRPHDDGSVMAPFTVNGLNEILWWLLDGTGFVRVMKPEALRRMFVRQSRAGLADNTAARRNSRMAKHE
jgi:hypothetical protein